MENSVLKQICVPCIW